MNKIIIIFLSVFVGSFVQASEDDLLGSRKYQELKNGILDLNSKNEIRLVDYPKFQDNTARMEFELNELLEESAIGSASNLEINALLGVLRWKRGEEMEARSLFDILAQQAKKLFGEESKTYSFIQYLDALMHLNSEGLRLARAYEIYSSQKNRDCVYFLELEKALIEFEADSASNRSFSDPGEFESIRIIRRYKSYASGKAILVAERNSPDRQKLIEAMPPDYVSKLDVNQLPADLWWYNSSKVPFSLTAGAIEYYYEKAKDALDSQKIALSGIDHLEFVYEADSEFRTKVTITEKGEFNNVFVVNQKMNRNYICGSQCGWGFSKRRFSIVDLNFKVLHVSGDGKTPTWISNSTEAPAGYNEVSYVGLMNQ